jgi:cation diffusion facilitator family transporter
MPVWGVAVMFVSAAVNIAVSQRLFKVGNQTDSVALQADAWHLRTDVYTSVGVMLGMAAILVGRMVSPATNLNWIDPTVAVLVALMIMRAAYHLTRKSARDLLDVSLPAKDIRWINEYVASISPPVRSVHKMRTRKAGSHQFIDFHLTVDESMSVADAHALGDDICIAIKEHLPNANVQVHIEPCALECTDSCVTGCLVDPAARTTGVRRLVDIGQPADDSDEINTIEASSEPD